MTAPAPMATMMRSLSGRCTSWMRTSVLVLLFLLSPTLADGTRLANDTRIVGGGVADAARFPYFAHLMIHAASGYWECGGILITNDLIVSAAHCVQGLDVLGIRAVVNMTQHFNAYTVDGGGPTGYEEIRDVEDFRQHSLYDSETQQNDVMLLVLDTPIVTIPFPDIPAPTFAADAGTPVTVIGFGDTQPRANFPIHLMEVEVQTVSSDACNDRNSYNGVVDGDTMICAGVVDYSRDACLGDSGGPLLIRKENNDELDADLIIGLVSWGAGCAREGYPGVYSKMSAFGDFIIGEGLCQMTQFNPHPDTMCVPYGPQPGDEGEVIDDLTSAQSDESPSDSAGQEDQEEPPSPDNEATNNDQLPNPDEPPDSLPAPPPPLPPPPKEDGGAPDAPAPAPPPPGPKQDGDASDAPPKEQNDEKEPGEKPGPREGESDDKPGSKDSDDKTGPSGPSEDKPGQGGPKKDDDGGMGGPGGMGGAGGMGHTKTRNGGNNMGMGRGMGMMRRDRTRRLDTGLELQINPQTSQLRGAQS